MTDFAGKGPGGAAGIGAATVAEATRVRAPAARSARLQHLRGVAALLVLLFHAGEYVDHLRGNGGYAALFPGQAGIYGVAVFFVLSGYLMARISRAADPFRFLLDRVLRIYPMAFIIGAAALLAYAATGFPRAPDPVSATLIPAGERGYLLGGIEWTLVLELTYYVTITVAILLGLRRWLVPGAALALAGLALATVLGLAPGATLTPTISQLYGQSANGAFLMGFLLPSLLRSRFVPGPALLLAGAVAIAALLLVTPVPAWRWVGGASALLLVAAAVRAPAPAAGRWNRGWLALGDASYALYLCHVPVIVISGNVMPEAVPDWAVFGGWVGVSIALALAFGGLDVGLHQRLKQWAAALPQARATLAGLVYLTLFAGIATVFDIRERAIAGAAAQARAVLAETTAQSWPGVRTDIDSSARLRNGRLVLRGFGIDLDAPDGAAHVALEQAGRVIGFERMNRMRAGTARALERPDLAGIRFGFSLVSDAPVDCAHGPLSARLVLPDGRVAPILSTVLTGLCGPGAPASAPTG